MRQMTSTLKTYRTSASNIGFAGKLVSQENLFFVTFAKITFANHYTCGGNKLHIMQKLVTLQFCDFLTNKEDGSN